MTRQKLDQLRVVLHQTQHAERVNETQRAQGGTLDLAISQTKALLDARGVERPVREPRPPKRKAPTLRPWSDILEAARAATPEEMNLAALLTEGDIETIVRKHQSLEAEFRSLHSLDHYDYMVAGVAGVLAALVDILLVHVPKHPGFLGGTASEGGWLSNVLKDKFGSLLPGDRIRALERDYPVPFDAATSGGLETRVPGLGPGTHRFQSPGHDPLLGWVFGVRDILKGEFTAFGKGGSLITQQVGEPHMAGERFLIRIFSALKLVAGHQVSDVATARGLPAPLMPLLIFVQTGRIGKQGYGVGEVARQMYRMGYDFRHFLASSVPVILIETIVRIAYFARKIDDGADLQDAIPLASNPKLRTQLFLGHSIATAANAGRVCITRNPLALNWAQWWALYRYLLPQVGWLLIGAERARTAHVHGQIEAGWQRIDEEFEELWRSTFDGDPAIL